MDTKNKDSDDGSEGEGESAEKEGGNRAPVSGTVDASASAVMTSTISAQQPFVDNSGAAQNSATNFGALSSFDNNLDLLGLMDGLGTMPAPDINGPMFDAWGSFNMSGQADRQQTWGAFSLFFVTLIN